MATATIEIEVDADTAQAYSQAPADERRKLELLMRLRLRELTAKPARALTAVMDEIGRNATANGLTAAGVEELLRAE